MKQTRPLKVIFRIGGVVGEPRFPTMTFQHVLKHGLLNIFCLFQLVWCVYDFATPTPETSALKNTVTHIAMFGCYIVEIALAWLIVENKFVRVYEEVNHRPLVFLFVFSGVSWLTTLDSLAYRARTATWIVLTALKLVMFVIQCVFANHAQEQDLAETEYSRV